MDTIIKIEAEDEFRYVIEDILNNLHDNQAFSNKMVSENSIVAVKTELKDVIFKTHCHADQVYESLLAKGYDKERSKVISSLIDIRRKELMYSMLLSYNSAHGETVSMFDWAIKLVYGTSELKKIKYPLLQLDFTTLGKGHQQHKIYDISKDVLDKLIRILEDVEKT